MRLNCKLLSYNIHAIQDAGKGVEDIDFNEALGTIDYTDPAIAKEMLDNAEEYMRDSSYDGYNNIEIEFYNYNMDALRRGLSELGVDIADISTDKLAKMITYALGYIDFECEY